MDNMRDDREPGHSFHPSADSGLSELIRWTVMHKLHKDPAISFAIASLEVDPRDPQAIEILHEARRNFERRQILSPDPFQVGAPTIFDDVDGPLVLGKTSNGTFYGIDPNALCRHLLIVGASGTGKTTIIKLLVAQMIGWRQ